MVTSNEYYLFSLTDRRRFLADAGFMRNSLRIWVHPDGRAIGESVAFALADDAFFQYVGIKQPGPPELSAGEADNSYEIPMN
jgi:hypothetical protein